MSKNNCKHRRPRPAPSLVVISTVLLLVLHSEAFVPHHQAPNLRPWGSERVFYSEAIAQQNQDTPSPEQDDEVVAAVRAPLKFFGPYPTLALRFPNLATTAQRAKNVTGVSLDFIVDTAANVNTINGAVAQELGLEQQGQALPGVGSAGAIQGGDTYVLGDAELEGVLDENDEPFVFMTNLTASALPVANPATAGLLSMAFLQSFEGGIEFCWGGSHGDYEAKPPSLTFYGDSVEQILQDRTRVSFDRAPVTQLPIVTINVNGVSMPALLDTGSPVTVLNAQAAKQAGVEATTLPAVEKSGNPFSSFANRFQQAQAASRGDVLTIMGTDGKPTNLVKSAVPPTVSLEASTNDGSNVGFGETPVYVGDLPGLEALKGLGVNAPPAVVLGMDILRQRPKMLLRAQQNEVWF